MKGFCPLASGSKGNATYVGTEDTKILIDVGISAKALLAKLGEINVDIGQIDAILVTHEHTDHIKGLLTVAKKLSIPVFANSDTAKGIYAALGDHPRFKIFSTGETFVFGDLEIHPFSIQHDTLDPVAFSIQTAGYKLGFCTDLGFATTLVKNHLQGCDYLVLESNHEPSMVHASARPMVYKQRVLSRQGHLSNQACAELLEEILHPGLKHVHLAHLSSECNSPDLALKITLEKLSEKGKGVQVSIAHQDCISRPILF